MNTHYLENAEAELSLIAVGGIYFHAVHRYEQLSLICVDLGSCQGELCVCSSEVLICWGSVDLYLLSAENSGPEFVKSWRLPLEVSGQEQPLHLHHLVWLLS